MSHTAPAYKTLPAKGWASISEDVPPEIYEVNWYKDLLRQDLRHVRVIITPVVRKPAKRKARR